LVSDFTTKNKIKTYTTSSGDFIANATEQPRERMGNATVVFVSSSFTFGMCRIGNVQRYEK
jgi:hypothetical protein